MNKKLENKEMEVKGYRELDSYTSYKEEGNKGTRHIVEPNSFKQKVLILINESKKQDKYLHYTLKTLFSCCHVKAHEDWLKRNFESGESNIYRTYNNIQKSIERNILEVLYTKDKIEGLTIKVNKHGSKDTRKWKLVVGMEYKELKIITEVNYNKMAKYIDLGELEETDFEGATTMLGVNHLSKQQYFDKTLKESFNLLDKAGSDLVKHRMKMEKEEE